MIPILPLNRKNTENAANILKKGGVIAHPADTCYGLAGLFGNKKALHDLQTLKGRDGKKPMSIMLPKSKKNDIRNYATLNEFSNKLCQTLLPGPITLLLPKGPKIPEWYFPETNLIGIRIPEDENCQTLLETLNEVIITTSANRSGEALCLTVKEIQNTFADRPNLLRLILSSPIPPPQIPSTVILAEGQSLKIIREGPISKKEIQEKMNMPKG